jgi:hypothetical protein
MYETASKFSRTHSRMKYRNIFVICLFGPLQSSLPPNAFNGCSICASAGNSAGTDFLEWLPGPSAIVPEFQWHLRNDTILAVISFSERIRNYRGHNQASETDSVPSSVFFAAKCFRANKAVCSKSLLRWKDQSRFRFHYGGFRLTCSLKGRNISL